LAKSVTPSRIEENKTIVKLDSSDMEALENFSKENEVKRFVYPEFGVNFGFPDKDTGMVLA
jgi:glycerol 2-dehydrogenase (NADP+)